LIFGKFATALLYVFAVLRQSSDNQVSFEFLTNGFFAQRYEEPLTFVVWPAFLQATPLLTLVAALAGRAVIDASTRAVAPATTMALRNMKTSIDDGVILANECLHIGDASGEKHVN
jgi:hypothetical protein